MYVSYWANEPCYGLGLWYVSRTDLWDAATICLFSAILISTNVRWDISIPCWWEGELIYLFVLGLIQPISLLYYYIFAKLVLWLENNGKDRGLRVFQKSSSYARSSWLYSHLCAFEKSGSLVELENFVSSSLAMLFICLC